MEKVSSRRSQSPSNVAKRKSQSPSNVAKRKSQSPSNVAKRKSQAHKTLKAVKDNDPYSTPFWPPSDYSVPAKIVLNNPDPLPKTLETYKLFIEKLKKILFNEKIIDRNNPQFKELLAEQQKWNHLFYNLKPYNIVCFVKCDYYLYDKKAKRVFHKNNEEPFYGNFYFKNLLKNNKMDMKWFDNNILYIHKNRF